MELGDQYERAITEAAEAKSAALLSERLAKRIFSACYLAADGTVAQREHVARTHEKYVAAEDDWLSKEQAANLALAHADVFRMKFETFRTLEATRRAEMTLR